jgi:hypothetical protein
MFKILSQPYPVEDTPRRQLRRAALIGLFIGLFLLVFQPFGLDTWNTANKPLKLLGFGFITFIITAFNFLAWQRLFPEQFSDKHWTVGREIILITGNILFIAIANRLYLEWLLNEGEDSGIGWVGMILITFLVGLFPTTGVVLLSYIRRLKKYTQLAAELPVHSSNLPDSTKIEVVNQPIKLIAENDKDIVVVLPSDLLFIESSDNYCTVVYLKNGQPAKPLLRSSLSRLESQIDVSHIVRCHRSYVVNLNRVERVTGNAQGYKVHLLGEQFQIPVARRYNDTLVAELKAL